MAHSARLYLSKEGQTTIVVGQVKQVTARLIAMSFTKDRIRYDDMFSVKSPNVMKVLLRRLKNKKVTAVIAPDGSDDNDGHPEVLEADSK